MNHTTDNKQNPSPIDPVEAELRALPLQTPHPAVDQATYRAALDALTNPPSPSLTERLFIQIAVPSALALTTLLYLRWAITAASSLY